MSRLTVARWSAALVVFAGLLGTGGSAGAAAEATPRTHKGGIAAVGALSSTGDVHDHHCTASIVDSPWGNLIMTAAHCLAGRHDFLFAPGYHDGLTPHGVWRSVGEPYIPSGWKDSHDINGAGSPYDFGFVVLGSQNGRNVQDVVGSALRLTTDVALPKNVDVYGYPSTGHTDYSDTSYTCTDVKASVDNGSWMNLKCLGIPGGFSGGPWIAHGTSDIIGVIGGKGQNLPDTNPDNYSVRFGAGVKALYDVAAKDKGGPSAPYSMGGGGTWKHAELITSGYYTGGSAGGARHMDMIVRWSDGEVTLYEGSSSTNGHDPFRAEYQLAPPKSIWTHAMAIAGGDFVGGGSYGLVVRWSDGEVTLYSHVDRDGFHGEIQLAAPNGTWKNAKLITAGKYTANVRRDDLIVVWIDGEVSLYSDLGANGIGAETRLLAPNGTWKNAEQISAGEFTGNNTADLMVRWIDGELTIYPDVNAGGFNGEVQVKAPNSLWKNATVVAAGAFAANARPNDVLVRWIDGEVSLYPAVDWAGLHTEVQLVRPA